ncbi:hypothetical protein PYCCODRAFT_1430794 [Trametes coccinea BRFM310]|uniref:Uncharacterized protein n=1 Tax=Trametes coccinea (strain BRFM310) TaxID=1353009 RepID=A0A1Y2J2B4_TRAC3|nr:hypothetical protein PYCCODRAFT_1430794 [Trametes coccinea BRFM310]
MRGLCLVCTALIVEKAQRADMHLYETLAEPQWHGALRLCSHPGANAAGRVSGENGRSWPVGALGIFSSLHFRQWPRWLDIPTPLGPLIHRHSRPRRFVPIPRVAVPWTGYVGKVADLERISRSLESPLDRSWLAHLASVMEFEGPFVSDTRRAVGTLEERLDCFILSPPQLQAVEVSGATAVALVHRPFHRGHRSGPAGLRIKWPLASKPGRSFSSAAPTNYRPNQEI